MYSAHTNTNELSLVNFMGKEMRWGVDINYWPILLKGYFKCIYNPLK